MNQIFLREFGEEDLPSIQAITNDIGHTESQEFQTVSPVMWKLLAFGFWLIADG